MMIGSLLKSFHVSLDCWKKTVKFLNKLVEVEEPFTQFTKKTITGLAKPSCVAQPGPAAIS